MRKLVKTRKVAPVAAISQEALVPVVSQESIAFQGPVCFQEMCAVYTEIRKRRAYDSKDQDYTQELTSLVARHTGINARFCFGDYEATVEIPGIDKNNILMRSFIQERISSADGLHLIATSKDMVRGTVNLKTAKVTGVFSEIPTTIYLPIYMLKSDMFTVEEVAASTMHELGHVFVYFEYMSRTVSSNQCLSAMSKALDGSDAVAERETILLSVKQAMNLPNLDPKELAKTTNTKAIEVVVITNLIKETVSELGSNIYDLNSYEYLADQFAVRMGCGRHQITALDKLHKGSGAIPFRSTPMYLAMEAIKMLLVCSSALSLWGIPLSLWGLMLMAMDSQRQDESVYTTPGARWKRIRNQIVENLKDRRLSADEVKRLQDDLAAIDTCMQNVNDRRQLLGVVFDFLSPNARKDRDMKVLQRDLEDLAANELFVKAAQLKHLGAP